MYIKCNYKERKGNLYYDDFPDDGITWQPDVYEYAVGYARSTSTNTIIDIGSGNGAKLHKYKDEFNIIFVDFGPNLDVIRKKFTDSSRNHDYIEHNFEKPFKEFNKLPDEAIVICSDVIEHIVDTSHILDLVSQLSKRLRMVILSTPDRLRTYGFDHPGPPLNRSHVREWTLEEMRITLEEKNIKPIMGFTRTNDRLNQRSTMVAIFGKDFESDKKIKYEYSKPIIDRDTITALTHKKALLKSIWKDDVEGIISLGDNDFAMTNYLKAINSGQSIMVNHFRFIDHKSTSAYYGSGVETPLRLIVQYVETTVIESNKSKLYPVSINLMHSSHYHGSLARETDLLSLSMGDLISCFILELLGDFSNNKSSNSSTFIKDYELQSIKNDELTLANRLLEVKINKILTNPLNYISEIFRKLYKKVK